MKRKKPRIEYDLAPHEKIDHIGGIQSLILDLAAGRKKPSTEKEHRLLKQIRAAEARGEMLDLPLD